MHFVRIDNRLVHGQVIETWLPYIRATMIVVVNNELSGNVLRQEIMSLAIPDGVEIVFLAVADVPRFFSRATLQDLDVLILFSSCEDARPRSRAGTAFIPSIWAICTTPRARSRCVRTWRSARKTKSVCVFSRSME
jgi:PTS system mannose-specific IIB component